jgi:hypothetical protein
MPKATTPQATNPESAASPYQSQHTIICMGEYHADGKYASIATSTTAGIDLKKLQPANRIYNDALG